MSAAKTPALTVDAQNEAISATTALREVVRIAGEQRRTASDEIIEEVPVALVYNGISHAVMLASPADLEDFALGFSLSEGILARPGELYDIEIVPSCDGLAVEMEIASERFVALKDRRRQLTGRTGCGLCGVESLAEVAARPDGRIARPDYRLGVDAVREALRQLPHWQTLREASGAAHAAAWADLAGNIRLVREDVGRHNALDKLIGALARGAVDGADGFVLVTSRASYEMVQKTASAGLPALIAVSAPTAMAVRQAERSGLLLAGFARAQGLVVYHGAERLDDSVGPAGPAALM